jgi:hypothetical protein
MPSRKAGIKASDKTFGGGKKPSERDSKVCAVCGKPFSWRKKWERDWENVKYCSDRCRAVAKTG